MIVWILGVVIIVQIITAVCVIALVAMMKQVEEILAKNIVLIKRITKRLDDLEREPDK